MDGVGSIGDTKRTASFSSLSLAVGNRVQLLMPRFPKSEAIVTELVGWSSPDFVLLRRPTERGLPVSISPGEVLHVRAFNGIDVAVFSTSLARLLGAPLKLLVVDYPASVQTLSLRSEPRSAIEIVASIRKERDGGNIEVTVSDLSLNGAKLRTADDLGGIGSEIWVAMPAQAGAKAVELRAEIRSLKRTEEETLVGIQFVDQDTQQLVFLQGLLSEAR